LHIITTPYDLYRRALASKALPEYLTTVLKHVTERVYFIKAQARLLKVLCKDKLIDFQC